MPAPEPIRDGEGADIADVNKGRLNDSSGLRRRGHRSGDGGPGGRAGGQESRCDDFADRRPLRRHDVRQRRMHVIKAVECRR